MVFTYQLNKQGQEAFSVFLLRPLQDTQFYSGSGKTNEPEEYEEGTEIGQRGEHHAQAHGLKLLHSQD